MDEHSRSQWMGCGITKLEPFLSLLSRFPGVSFGIWQSPTWDLELPPREDAHPAFPSMFGVLQEVLQESRKTKQMALKIIPGSEKKKK